MEGKSRKRLRMMSRIKSITVISKLLGSEISRYGFHVLLDGPLRATRWDEDIRLTHGNPVTQGNGNPLCFAAYTNMASDRYGLCFFRIRQSPLIQRSADVIIVSASPNRL
jgi:hypothetical protein